MNRKHLFAVGAATIAGLSLLAAWGPLDPPNGPIAPTYKTLTEVEPRIPVSADTTPGDANSTFKITSPGSYYLTSNITGEPGKSGISIAVGQVTLDLGGFRVQGVDGAVSGVRIGSVTAVTVRNGVIAGWTDGIFGSVATASKIDSVVAQANSNYGILSGPGSIITSCTLRVNTRGVSAARGSVIRDTVAYGNTVVGFDLSGATATGCSALENTNFGFDVLEGSALSDCTAIGNSGSGIVLDDQGRATRCLSRNNETGFRLGEQSSMVECTAAGNHSDGARITGNANTVERCTLGSNGENGLNVSAGRGNNLDGNQCMYNIQAGLVVSSTDNLAVRNRCRGNPGGDYSIGAGNDYGVILTNPGQGFSSSAAWANFAY